MSIFDPTQRRPGEILQPPEKDIVQYIYPAAEKIVEIPGHRPQLDDPSNVRSTRTAGPPPRAGRIKYSGTVPTWKVQSSHSLSELKNASPLHKAFYSKFRDGFLMGTYYDLDGNHGYAFMLLYELLGKYDSGPNSRGIENYLYKLGHFYPPTKSYLRSSLYRRMGEIGDLAGMNRILNTKEPETKAPFQRADTQPEQIEQKPQPSQSAVIKGPEPPIQTIHPSVPIPRQPGSISARPAVKAPDDHSIIDVTGQSFMLIRPAENSILVKMAGGVPAWPHQYVYSASELDQASPKQNAFYLRFRNEFARGTYVDLEGNSNYAFILLFDLVGSYNAGPRREEFFKWFEKLGELYPKTERYISSALLKRMTEIRDHEGIERVRQLQAEEREARGRQTYLSGYEYEYWRLGSNNKKRLGLNDEEVKLLNRLTDASNSFLSLQYCCDQVIAIFLKTVVSLRSAFEVDGPSLDSRLNALSDAIAIKHYRYRSNSENYRYCIQFTTDHLYSLIFKRCENAVRENYGHKRKLNAEGYYSDTLKAYVEDGILTKAKEIIASSIGSIRPPDRATEVELNRVNTTRWKLALEKLTSNTPALSPNQFSEKINDLGELNRKNPSIENIFFEASKFISKNDKQAALGLYIRYLYYDLKSAKFDNRKLTKTIQKSLFSSQQQLHDFERIVSELISTKDLNKALAAVPAVYEVKRKTIKLNRDAIHVARDKHSETVDLLNEFLQDEFEDDQNSIVSTATGSEEVLIEITTKLESKPADSVYVIDLSQLQTDLLELFAKSSFTVSYSDLESFAREKGAFRNQIIDSLNEACYETLNDVFIEDDDELYVANEDYYRMLLKV